MGEKVYRKGAKMSRVMDREQRLADAIKKDDSWWTTMFPGYAANRVVAVIGDTGVTPNQVTVFSFFLAVIAGACFWQGTHFYLIIAAVIIQAQLIFDCVDGQLARYKNMSSPRGGWLDMVVDRFKDFIYFFSLCRGRSAVSGEIDIWALGFIAYFISSTSVYLYSVRAKFLKEGESQTGWSEMTSSTDQLGEQGLVDQLYSFIKRRAYFLSFSLPDQLLVISIFCILNAVRGLMWVLIVWGAMAIAFSLLRTWKRLGDENHASGH